jgi:hypothetical protein
MATLSLTTPVNLFDILKQKGADGRTLEAAEILNEVNDPLRMLPNYPASGGTFHEGLRDTSLPGGEFATIGGTWGESKGTEERYVEGLCLIRSSMSIPTDVLSGMGKQLGIATVNHKKRQHLEGMMQSWSNLLLKGVSTPDQRSIIGLQQRPPYNAVDSEYTYTVGGTGTNLRSAWLMAPGPATVHLLHNPLHPTLGVQYQEKPETYKVDPDSSTKHNYIIPHEFEFQGGICIADQRAVKRLCNIPAAFTDDVGADIVRIAIRASLKHSFLSNGQWILFCDGDVYGMLVTASNSVTKVYTDAKNIWNTDLPTIGSGKGSIVIARWDSLNYAAGAGETLVTA